MIKVGTVDGNRKTKVHLENDESTEVAFRHEGITTTTERTTGGDKEAVNNRTAKRGTTKRCL